MGALQLPGIRVCPTRLHQHSAALLLASALFWGQCILFSHMQQPRGEEHGRGQLIARLAVGNAPMTMESLVQQQRACEQQMCGMSHISQTCRLSGALHACHGQACHHARWHCALAWQQPPQADAELYGCWGRPFEDKAWFNSHVQHKIHKRRGARDGPSADSKREGYRQLRIATQACPRDDDR